MKAWRVDIETLYIVNYYSMKEGHRFELINAKGDDEARYRADQFIKDEIKKRNIVADDVMYLWLSKAIKKE